MTKGPKDQGLKGRGPKGLMERRYRSFLWFAAGCLATALAVFVFTHHIASPDSVDRTALPRGARYLEAAYGPDRYSQFAEEWIIRDFFKDRKNGFFVDVGANHYRDSSTTYYLEQRLDWSGLAIEPLQQFEADYKTHRPSTRFLPFFVSDVSDQQAKLYVLDKHTVVSSSDRAFTERTGANPREMLVPTITLNDLLQKQGVERIDFLSMDIELSEPKALAGFDVRRYRPELVCIEAHSEVKQQILDYFARNGYVIVSKYMPADEHNLYFTPLQ